MRRGSKHVTSVLENIGDDRHCLLVVSDRQSAPVIEDCHRTVSEADEKRACDRVATHSARIY